MNDQGILKHCYDSKPFKKWTENTYPAGAQIRIRGNYKKYIIVDSDSEGVYYGKKNYMFFGDAFAWEWKFPHEKEWKECSQESLKEVEA